MHGLILRETVIPNGENVPQWSTYTAEKEATMVFDTQSGERVAFDKELQDLMK